MKHARKLLCILLALTMLSLVLVGCKKDDVQEGETSGDTAGGTEAVLPEGALGKDDLSKLVIVRAADADENVISAVNLLKKEFKNVFGVTVKILSDKSTAEEGAIQLIVGQTARSQSAKALEKLDGYGYVYGHCDGQIVINAEYSYYLLMAIEQFIADYVSEGAEYLALPKELAVVKKEAYVLAENGTPQYGIVADTVYSEQTTLFLNKMSAYTGAKLIDTSKLKPTVKEYEVLIGETDRPESEEALRLIGYDEAIVTVINKKLVVRGWFDNTTEKAIERLMEMIEEYYSADKKCVFVPDGLSVVISTDQSFELDIPEYEGGKITCAQDVGQGNFLFYIKDTNATEFEAYKSLLAKSGYTLYTQYNDQSSIKSATYKSADTMIHVYYIANENAVRIITAPMEGTTLPPVVSEPQAVGSEVSSVTQVMIDYYDYTNKDDGNFGNIYVIRLADGSLLIYDGGNKFSDTDVERLWAVMNKQATKKNGKIVVAGWIITHEHQDHFEGMDLVIQKYGSQIKIENVYCNTVTDAVAAMGGGKNAYIDTARMSAAQQTTGFKVVRVHTGQRFWIRNAMIEVLYTPEDMYPDGIKEYQTYADFNDTSMVTRVTIDGTTFINLGDAYATASNTLVRMWGSELRSDISTIAHHGWGGGSKELYDCIDAERYFFPFSQKAYDAIISGTDSYIQWAITRYNAYSYPFYTVLQHIEDKVGVSKILVADHFNKEIVFADRSLIIHEDNNGHGANSTYSQRYSAADYRNEDA